MFESLSQLAGLAGTIASFLVVLGVVVFVHEFGHYIVARWCGIQSEVFSIGFGKELYGWTDSRGTRWRVAALPLGGYVKFLGDRDSASAHPDSEALAGLSREERAHAFPTAALWRRAATVAAGPVFNFALAILIYAGIALGMGLGSERPVIGQVAAEETALRSGDTVLSVAGEPVDRFGEILNAYSAASEAEPGRSEFPVTVRREGDVVELVTGPVVPPMVGRVAPGSPADEAGLESGDRILTIDGEAIGSFSDLQRKVAEAGESGVTLTVEPADGGETYETRITPTMNPAPTPDGGVEMRPLIGITAIPLIGPEAVTPGPLTALSHGAGRTWQVISSSLTYVGALVTGQADSSALGGPIRIASLSGDAAASGLVSFVAMIALISASIGMINLFPIPVLDGGHLLFYALEAVRGKPLNERLQEIATGAGLAAVILLMVFVTLNDLQSL